MLATHQLTFAYSPTRQFAFPDLLCANCQALLILGQSGTGKTTLLHLLARLLTPTGGSVQVDTDDLTLLSPAAAAFFRASQIGIIYQKPHFVTALSVLDNLLLANYLARKPTNLTRARHLADQLGFGSLLGKKTTQLSQGEQQRVGIARAVMNQPTVILADEPTSSLDDENCGRVVQLLSEQSETLYASLIVVTHDRRLKEQFSNQIILTPAH